MFHSPLSAAPFSFSEKSNYLFRREVPDLLFMGKLGSIQEVLPSQRSVQPKSLQRKSRVWKIFMEQELRFGLDLGRLAVLKKRFWVDYEQLLRVVSSCFQGQKKCKKNFRNISNCVLLQQRHLTAGLIYNDFACSLAQPRTTLDMDGTLDFDYY